MNTRPAGRPEPGWYEIHLQGRLDERWSTWFDGMTLTTVTTGAGSSTVLRGLVVDQAALHGLLTRLRDIGVPLISVARIDPDPSRGRAVPSEEDR